MARRAARVGLVKAVVVLALLGGCAAQNDSESVPDGSLGASASAAELSRVPEAPTAQAAACAHIYQGAAATTLSAAEILVQVRVCTENPGNGEVTDVTLAAAESQENLDWLAGLLAEPSATRDESLICTAELRSVPDFVVTTQSGLLLAPAVPTDPCGKPSLNVVKILEQIATS